MLDISSLLCFPAAPMDQIAPDQLPPQIPQPQAQRPGVIKVFGIMHLILGIVGVIGGLVTVATQMASKAVLQKLSESMPEDEAAAFLELTVAYSEKLAAVTYFDLLARVIIAVLMIVAAVALLKSKRGAVKKSNLYAFVSIGLKVLMLGIVVAVVIPATNEYYEAMASAGPEQSAGMVQMQKALGSAGQVITPIISVIYPILALILLNRKPVRDWLAQHGA